MPTVEIDFRMTRLDDEIPTKKKKPLERYQHIGRREAPILHSVEHSHKNRHKFLTNWFVGNFLQSTYKIDMCPLACEKHILFK
jgi:hypothetical protein